MRLDAVRLERIGRWVGTAVWSVWFASVIAGGGQLQALAGSPLGEDWLVLHAAGEMVRTGQGASLLDPEAQRAAQHAALGAAGWDGFNLYTSPPWVAVALSPLSHLPFHATLALLWALSLGVLWLGLRALGLPERRAILATLLCFPAFADALKSGQTSVLTLGILCLATAARARGELLRAGLLVGLLLYKPQVATGAALVLLLESRRQGRAVVGMALSASAWVIVGLLGEPDVCLAWLGWMGRVALGSEPLWKDLPLTGGYTFRAFFSLLLPGLPALARPASLLATIATIAGFLWWRRRARPGPDAAMAAAVVLTLLASPHVLGYEWTLLCLPALVLWRRAPAQRRRLAKAFALVWMASAWSITLARVQVALLGVAAHLAVPALLAAVWLGRRSFDGTGSPLGVFGGRAPEPASPPTSRAP